ncbi:MAG: magnesium transporter [Nautilia sp.]|nr:MAG: magnesium transporter [Nautilia sp.]
MKFVNNKFLIEDIINKDHPSDFEVTKEYAVLILRLPYIRNDEVKIVSYPFLIKDNEVYIFERHKEDFDKLGSFDDLYEFLDVRIDKILAKLNKYHMQIAKMEDSLYENKIDKNFSNEWLKLKRDLSLIERLMGHSLIAYERFMKYFKLKENFAFVDLEEYMNRSFRFSKSAIEKLDYIYEFVRVKQDEKMNKIMFVLTLLSGIFLPLTLITGFFGMNTGGLPFSNDSDGTIKAVILGIVFEIPIMYMIYKMMRD